MPEAEVARREEAIAIVFSGPGGELTVSVPLKYVGGYEVRRGGGAPRV